ncbi:metallophosphoesterase [Sedimentibacter hydroxybenzoicus DSM 7310]|uniref:Metallophosphoesterase n=1 Tax=Sedimentibacter hydroxybenzoicus DSM 7310 TaxID=1123245 RepID=A0A974GVD9_SEDHY|nr:metallophosphoesterase [Sedimentibacter hydroxybenzoicus]NYB73268.1 metallophosphoesterase [Sedimentibacter hydroxybenzoicus DSM 7310]
MKNFKNAYVRLLSLFNYPYISKELLKDIKGPILLHISDTPVDIYSYIYRIVDILKPQYIIHTGDMADNIKLEIYKNRIDCYFKGIKRFIERLEKNEFTKIYYVLGNHDDYKTVSQLTKKGTILEDDTLTINGCNISVSHYYKDNSYNNIDFNLYGHSFEPAHYNENGTIGLNGLLNINIIDLSDKRVFHLEYPVNTNVSRGMKLKRIGL